MKKAFVRRNTWTLCLAVCLMMMFALPASAASKKTVYVISKLTLKYNKESFSNSQNFSYNANGLVTGYKGSIEPAKISNTSRGSGSFSYSGKNNTAFSELSAESGMTSYYYYKWNKGRVKTGSSILAGGQFKYTYTSNKKKKVTSVVTGGDYARDPVYLKYDKKGRLGEISSRTPDNTIYTIAYDSKGNPKTVTGRGMQGTTTYTNTYKNKRLKSIQASNEWGSAWTCNVKLKKMSIPSDYAAAVTSQQRQILLTYVCRLPLSAIPMGGI